MVVTEYIVQYITLFFLNFSFVCRSEIPFIKHPKHTCSLISKSMLVIPSRLLSSVYFCARATLYSPHEGPAVIFCLHHSSLSSGTWDEGEEPMKAIYYRHKSTEGERRIYISSTQGTRTQTQTHSPTYTAATTGIGTKNTPCFI